jgi:ATP-dependent Clp protease protease subunit
MATTPTKLPEEVYTIFCGPIEQATAQKIVGGLTTASVNKVKHVHVLFQSAGGYIGDGVFLYNLFHTMPIELTFYNVGQISSAGVIAYLGAKRRKTTRNATFMLHRGTNSTQFATSSKLKHITQTLVLDDERTEAIVRKHVKMPDELWQEMAFHDLYLSGEEALKYGFATDIGEFSPPIGIQVFNLIG